MYKTRMQPTGKWFRSFRMRPCYNPPRGGARALLLVSVAELEAGGGRPARQCHGLPVGAGLSWNMPAGGSSAVAFDIPVKLSKKTPAIHKWQPAFDAPGTNASVQSEAPLQRQQSFRPSAPTIDCSTQEPRPQTRIAGSTGSQQNRATGPNLRALIVPSLETRRRGTPAPREQLPTR